ncbi:molybdate ABC transporter substrate-binding protein [Xanthomonas sp. XNM01]|uniref:molybdate ABC transporter substrate-binding protein n=1 Tax=Xanthomonas sp. XNM01 TaxID=2769289 RepID=UPI00177D2014|nr:molybdate ABC transporter substrate-binding protein [Xanthomonas sp. XNM01]MBD9369397.1 molybdate ABC transporter substrate-binding protein [Xanthomonas sp. XNM01]
MSRLIRLALLPLLALLGSIATPPASAQAGQPLTVFAAASLKESLDEAAARYRSETGTTVRVSYAASSTLARQIEQGAPAGVFISADQEWMDHVQRHGALAAGTRRNLLGNSLVLVAPAGSNVRVDLARSGSLVAALAGKRLAVGQTASVPAGKYAREALEHLGHWDAVSGQLAEADSVRAALMLVSRAEVPLGIVYGSDAEAEPKVRVVATFPPSSHAAIVYPAAALDRGGPQAAAFVRWLASPEARRIFERRGFTLTD